MRNLHRRFDRYYIGRIYSGDFAKICGLLRIYEIYTIYQNFKVLRFHVESVLMEKVFEKKIIYLGIYF